MYWSKTMIKDLKNQHGEKLKAARDLIDKAEAEKRNLSKEEKGKYDVLMDEVLDVKARIDRLGQQEELEREAVKESAPVATAVRAAGRTNPRRDRPGCVPRRGGSGRIRGSRRGRAPRMPRRIRRATPASIGGSRPGPAVSPPRRAVDRGRGGTPRPCSGTIAVRRPDRPETR